MKQVPALLEINGRVFSIGRSGVNNYLFELFRDGTRQAYGVALPGDRRPQMVSSQTQILILLAGIGYGFDLATNTLTRITAEGWPANVTKCGYQDGYFVVLKGNSQGFGISALNDVFSWDALDFGAANGEPGNIVSFAIAHRQLWLCGVDHGEIYYNSGNADFPFARLDGAQWEQGTCAIDSVQKFDNSLIFLGADKAGSRVLYRMNGYTPNRVSTHAMEVALQSYPRVDDATSYVYQDGGHVFYRIDFPSANEGRGATWVYDGASDYCHERTYLDPVTGLEWADRAMSHVFAFEKHLVGDSLSDTIFVMSSDLMTDNGDPIRRERTAPDIDNSGKLFRQSELRLTAQTGVGLDGGVVPGADPQCYLSLSNDGGRTWGKERSKSLGKLGEYRKLLRWRQLGRSYDRAYKWVCSEPVFVALLAADVDVS